MRHPLSFVIFICMICCFSVPAAATREGLVIELKSALSKHDKIAFEKCFNLEGSDPKLKPEFTKMVDQVLAWPSNYIFTTEWTGKGKTLIVKEGKNFTYNGDAKFNVGLYVSKPPAKGFVFPAGFADGKCQILLLIEEKK